MGSAVLRFLLGLVSGMCANVIICRLPRNESVFRSPHCVSCGRRLSVFTLVPVLNRLFSRSPCEACAGKASWRYPAVAFLCAFLFASVEPRLCLFVFFLVCISFIDVDTQTIPDSLVIALGISGLMNIRGVSGTLLGVAVGGGSIFLIDRVTWLLAKKAGFGLGDVFLMAAIGLTLGFKLTLQALFFGFVTAAVAGICVKRLKPGISYIPFAPFLSIGAVLSIWLGDGPVSWYIRLLRL